jgi:predicted TPR repeat methyltransferase
MTANLEKAKELFLEGLDHFGAGRWADAEDRFVSSLALVPGRISTLINLGATRVRLGKPQAALDPLTQVLAAEPDNVDAWFHRGTALGALARHDEALVCFDNVVALDSGYAAGWYQRAHALSLLHRPAEALESTERFLALAPEHGEAWFRHGKLLQVLDRHEEALASYEKAVGYDPTLGQAWSNRGALLKDMQRLEEAALCFRNAIDRGADAELNEYFLASALGARAPATAPRRYVEPLFDGYAARYDEHMTRVLKYRAPALLIDGLGGRHFVSALDLGCGTGLCGPLLKPLVDRLDGVDLSANMLDEARALGAYTRLIRMDMCEYLRGAPARYDLILAADVFIYVGDLTPVFTAVQGALNDEGVFCFSVEVTDDEKDFELLPSSRYAHSARYIGDLAVRHGFELTRVLREPIREDQRQPVAGLFFHLTRTP